MKKVETIGHVDAGKLEIPDRANFAARIAVEFGDGLNDVVVSVSEKSRRRSNQQNRYLWGVAYKILASETGHSEEEMHEFCKAKFLEKRVIDVGDESLEIASTAELSTSEFEKYAEDIRRWAASFLNIDIPEPNE